MAPVEEPMNQDHETMSNKPVIGIIYPPPEVRSILFQTHALWRHARFHTYYNMTVWILAGNYISFTIAAGLIRLHMPGVKKSRV